MVKLDPEIEKIIIGEDETEVVAVMSRLVRVRCHWGDPFAPEQKLKEVMENMLENPLYIVNQAIVALDRLREVLTEESTTAADFIRCDAVLDY